MARLRFQVLILKGDTDPNLNRMEYSYNWSVQEKSIIIYKTLHCNVSQKLKINRSAVRCLLFIA